MTVTLLTEPGFSIRTATERDLPAILRFIHALAAFEKLTHAVRATEEDLRAALFGPAPRAQALIAQTDGAPIGFAVWYYNFSTFAGHAGIFLEDLWIEPAYRRRGVAAGFFTALARIAGREGLPKIDWSVLDWNEQAIGFYRRIGARDVEEWKTMRLDGPALRNMALGIHKEG